MATVVVSEKIYIARSAKLFEMVTFLPNYFWFRPSWASQQRARWWITSPLSQTAIVFDLSCLSNPWDGELQDSSAKQPLVMNTSWLLSSPQDGESEDLSAKQPFFFFTLLDFLAAFEMVNYKTLLSKHMKLKMSGPAMHGFLPIWLGSYIRGFTYPPGEDLHWIPANLSSWFCLRSWWRYILSGKSYHCYTDDTQLNLSFLPQKLMFQLTS